MARKLELLVERGGGDMIYAWIYYAIKKRLKRTYISCLCSPKRQCDPTFLSRRKQTRNLM